MKTTILLLTTILTIACSNQRKPIVDYRNINMEFKVQGFNSGYSITLGKDSTFTYETYLVTCALEGAKSTVSGTYSRIDNKVQLEPDMVRKKSFNADTTKVVEFPFSKDSFRLRTNYYLVNIDDQLCLLSPDYPQRKDGSMVDRNDFHTVNDYYTNRARYEQTRNFGKPFFTANRLYTREFSSDKLPEELRDILRK